MEFNFEEKFIFGHQNFLNCCFKVQFGSGSKSNCVLVDCSGVLYFPVSSDLGEVAIHRAELKEILNKNITITSAYHVEHNERSYLFFACDAEEGGGYRLITYCTSHYDIYSKDKDLVAWQTLELPFKIMDAKSLTDENQNSIILLCGSDKRTHIYSLDAQCIVVRRKKSHAFRNSVIDQLLLFEDKGYECLTSALPIRLFINQIHSIENYSVSDILLGYSNGIIIWYHETILLQISHNEFDFIQEIPLFQGKSNSPNSVDSNTNKSDLLLPRKSRSANDLSKGFEEILSINNPNDEFEGRSKSSDQLTNLDITLPLTSITEEESEDESLPGLPSIPPVYVPEIITTEVPHIERKILFFDGVFSCCCFYDIPFSNNSQSNDSSQRNLQRLSLQSKNQLSIPCIVVGLANGSTLLVQFSDVENPHAILPKSYSHGGVRAISQEFISNNRCRDIVSTFFFLFIFFASHRPLFFPFSYLFTFENNAALLCLFECFVEDISQYHTLFFFDKFALDFKNIFTF